MKSQILLFFAILSLSVFKIQAQPGPYRPFQLDDKCLSFDKDEIVFLGRIVSIEQAGSSKPLPEFLREAAIASKVKVSVTKVLNGKLGKKKIDFFEGLFRSDLKVGDYRIFVLREITNLSKTESVLIAQRWSDWLYGENKGIRKHIYSIIETKLNEILISAISGKVVQRKKYSQLIISDQFPGNADRLDFFTPVEGITLEATRVKDGKTFQTKTDSNGEYNFYELKTGSYKIHLVTPTGFQEVSNKNENVIYTIKWDRENLGCSREVFFELKKN